MTQNEMKQVSKFIRDTTYNPPYESGMSYQQAPPQYMRQKPQELPQQQQQQQQLQEPQEQGQLIEAPQQHHNHQMHRILSLSCIDVAEHTANCIVCSKLYNTDNTLYIITIAILLLISAILLKKVLDLQK